MGAKRVERLTCEFAAIRYGRNMKSNRSKHEAKSISSNSSVPRTIPPSPNELELSLFGPGVGECLVVHLGSGNWMIVDSCLKEPRGRPIALEYLESLNVDVGSQVKLVVVTHWNDDHIQGIGEIVRAASSARFACSAALGSREFFSV